MLDATTQAAESSPSGSPQPEPEAKGLHASSKPTSSVQRNRPERASRRAPMKLSEVPRCAARAANEASDAVAKSTSPRTIPSALAWVRQSSRASSAVVVGVTATLNTQECPVSTVPAGHSISSTPRTLL